MMALNTGYSLSIVDTHERCSCSDMVDLLGGIDVFLRWTCGGIELFGRDGANGCVGQRNEVGCITANYQNARSSFLEKPAWKTKNVGTKKSKMLY